MVFSSTVFLFLFLPLTILGYYLLREDFRNYWLLCVSLFFFAWSQPKYLWIILVNIALNYSASLLIDRFRQWSRVTLILGVTANLGLLFYFKYFDFVIRSLNMLFGSDWRIWEIVLPIGISFFTFQGMSYMIDVYRRDVSVQRNPLKVALYIVLFPQLIAGPIVRYKDIAAEIDRRSSSLDDFSSGVERFIIGLGKKAVLANTLAVTADTVWETAGSGLTCPIAWIGSIAYTLQIYYDFSGYSDMAIGLGRMFGFHFNENFNLPYVSASITEFWRRWHISLSSWFRDYVYIPLGGNRKRVYLNLAIVFLLTGIWHGAAVTFIVWGLWNGFFIITERWLRKRAAGRQSAADGRGTPGDRLRERLGGAAAHIYTLLVVSVGWVIFRAPSMKDAVVYLGVMSGLYRSEGWLAYSLLWYLDKWTVFVAVMAVFFATSLPQKLSGVLRARVPEAPMRVVRYILLLGLLYLSMLRIVSGTYNPFIYFRF